MKTITEQLNVKEFPFIIKDKNGNIIYYEFEDKSWVRRELDEEGNETYYETYSGFWSKSEYDSNNNNLYYEDSYGYKSDNRVVELTLDQIAEKFGIEVSQLKIKK